MEVAPIGLPPGKLNEWEISAGAPVLRTVSVAKTGPINVDSVDETPTACRSSACSSSSEMSSILLIHRTQLDFHV